MDEIHNDHCIGHCQGESAKVGIESDDVDFVCMLCETERVKRVKAYYAEIQDSWIAWHAKHGTYRHN